MRRWLQYFGTTNLLDRLWCCLVGHDDMKRVHGPRLYVQCVACGRETKGLTIELGKVE